MFKVTIKTPGRRQMFLLLTLNKKCQLGWYLASEIDSGCQETSFFVIAHFGERRKFFYSMILSFLITT